MTTLDRTRLTDCVNEKTHPIGCVFLRLSIQHVQVQGSQECCSREKFIFSDDLSVIYLNGVFVAYRMYKFRCGVYDQYFRVFRFVTEGFYDGILEKREVPESDGMNKLKLTVWVDDQ